MSTPALEVGLDSSLLDTHIRLEKDHQKIPKHYCDCSSLLLQEMSESGDMSRENHFQTLRFCETSPHLQHINNHLKTHISSSCEATFQIRICHQAFFDSSCTHFVLSSHEPTHRCHKGIPHLLHRRISVEDTNSQQTLEVKS